MLYTHQILVYIITKIFVVNNGPFLFPLLCDMSIQVEFLVPMNMNTLRIYIYTIQNAIYIYTYSMRGFILQCLVYQK